MWRARINTESAGGLGTVMVTVALFVGLLEEARCVLNHQDEMKTPAGHSLVLRSQLQNGVLPGLSGGSWPSCGNKTTARDNPNR